MPESTNIPPLPLMKSFDVPFSPAWRAIRMVFFAVAAAISVISTATAATILIDFGSSTTTTASPDSSGRTWTNISDSNDLSGNPHVLTDTTNVDSGLRLTISNPAGTTNAIGFNGANSAGVSTAGAITGEALARSYPVNATRDSLFGNSGTFGAGVVQAVRLTISNLDPVQLYSFDFFASRLATDSANREGEYRVTGGASGTVPTSVFLNATENYGNIVGVSGFAPDANNQIVIDIDAGPNNNVGNGFYYLGVLEIRSIPEPSVATVFGIGSVLLLARRRGRRASGTAGS